jgi:hypothetical protein
LGRYGPHSNDALLDVDSPSDAVANASIQAQNMSGKCDINEHSQGGLDVQLCVFNKFRPSRKRRQLASAHVLRQI